MDGDKRDSERVYKQNNITRMMNIHGYSPKDKGDIKFYQEIHGNIS